MVCARTHPHAVISTHTHAQRQPAAITLFGNGFEQSVQFTDLAKNEVDRVESLVDEPFCQFIPQGADWEESVSVYARARVIADDVCVCEMLNSHKAAMVELGAGNTGAGSILHVRVCVCGKDCMKSVHTLSTAVGTVVVSPKQSMFPPVSVVIGVRNQHCLFHTARFVVDSVLHAFMCLHVFNQMLPGTSVDIDRQVNAVWSWLRWGQSCVFSL